MILRKPYAFFIKHFKLIHGIILLCMIYLLYITSNLATFYSHVAEVKTIVGESNLPDLFNKYIYIAIFISLFLIICIIILLIKKGYKFLYYMINAIALISLIIFYLLAYKNIEQMQKVVVEATTYMAFNDIATILFYVQGALTFIWLIKATGFDIKTFDFGKDLIDFDSTDEDNEEVEFDFEFDSNEIKTTRKRKTRNLKYYYVENRFKINLIIFIFAVAITIFVAMKIDANKEIIYTEGTELLTYQYGVEIKKTYVTNLNYKYEKKYGPKNFIILMLDLKKNTIQEQVFESQNVILELNDERYYPTTDYATDFLDFGNNYNKQKLTNDFVPYFMIYEIPYEFSSKDVYAYIVNYFDYTKKEYNFYKIKLNYQKINYDYNYENYDLNEEMTIDHYGIHTNIKITDVEFAEKYKLVYKYINNNIEYDSIEYLTPIASDNEDKIIMRLKLEQTFSKSERQYKFYNLITNFGEIEYEIDNVKKEGRIYSLLTPKNINEENTYYIEVSKEILNAKKRNLRVKIRDQIFVYDLEEKYEEKA